MNYKHLFSIICTLFLFQFNCELQAFSLIKSPVEKGHYILNSPLSKVALYLKSRITSHWEREQTMLQDGIACEIENNQKEVTVRLRRYARDIPKQDPFLFIKIAEVEPNTCTVTVWEGGYAAFTNLNLSRDVPEWLDWYKTKIPQLQQK